MNTDQELTSPPPATSEKVHHLVTDFGARKVGFGYLNLCPSVSIGGFVTAWTRLRRTVVSAAGSASILVAMESNNAVTFALCIVMPLQKLFLGLRTHALSWAFCKVGGRRSPLAESDSPFHELALPPVGVIV